MTTMYLSGRHSPSTRQWITLGAAAAVVLVLVLLVAFGCQARTGAGAAPSGDTGAAGSAPATPAPATPAPGNGTDGSGGVATGGALGSTPPPGDDEGGGADNSGGNQSGGNGNGNDGDGGQNNGGGPAVLAGLEVVSTDRQVAAGGVLVDHAMCPDGKVVVGGGVWVNLTSPEDFKTQLRESGPVATSPSVVRRWRAVITNGAEEARMIRIFAVCAVPPPSYQLVNEDVVLPSGGGHVRSWALCPQGTVALSGGAYVITPGLTNRVRLQESMLLTPFEGWGWVVAASNTDTVDRTVRISAVCSEEPAGFDVVRTDHVMNGSGFLSVPHWCPEGTHILGGGAGVVGALAGNYRTFLRESGPIHIGGDYRGWWLGLSKASSAQHTVRVSATCVATG
jgi:hypothetical protein